MKNDVKKVNEITTEMRINDLIYKIIDDELDDMIYPEQFCRVNGEITAIKYKPERNEAR